MQILKGIKNLYKLAQILQVSSKSEQEEKPRTFYLHPNWYNQVVLGRPSMPFSGLHLSKDTLHIEKATGADHEELTLTYDSGLGEYVLKPAKGGSGALYNFSVLGNGSARGLTVKTDNKVGINRVPTARLFEVGGDMDCIGQVYISPGSALPPLVLNANAQGQLVTGLNAEKLGGTTLAGLAHAEVLDRSFGDTTVGNTITETSIYSYTVVGNSLSTNKGLRLIIAGTMVWNAGAAGDRFTIKVKLGATTIISHALAKDSSNSATRTVVIVITLWNTGATNTQEAIMDGKAVIAAETTSIPIGGYGTAAEDTTSNKTLDVTVTWTLANTLMTFTKKFAILERLN